jgi:hypothetical protein
VHSLIGTVALGDVVEREHDVLNEAGPVQFLGGKTKPVTPSMKKT